ncbi:hypothetical protein [Leisingera sp. ANG-M7]|uniref:hypothetical protein n=1 Tax=Leisingera sp. ANG-M7 TaxID=1577902 RepID=UPI00057D8FE0|nr:hypothetical protein [Leisingera sp. ANG-M7]KIC34160.1 biopolymer transporter ExbD [Leisingera sp. ANG-M7]
MLSRRSLLPPHKALRTPGTSLAIVNIVLLLLFFFLVTGSLVPAPDTQVQLPATRELPSGHLPSPLLEVEPNGSLRLDGNVITAGSLQDTLPAGQVLHVLTDSTASALDLLQLLAQPPFPDLDIRLVTRHSQAGS